MARVKRAVNAKKRHKSILKQAKGYFGAKSKLFRPANQAVMKSLNYSYIGTVSYTHLTLPTTPYV